jgi:hypothetical protein
MKKKYCTCLAVLLIAVMPKNTFAWGKAGHNIISDLAYTLTDSVTRQKVQHYLDTTTFEQAGTWMDDVRKIPQYDYMKPWHYVNIEEGKEYEPAKEGDLLTALNKAINELEHRDTMDDLHIKQDLMIVFHLVEDLHMPLHSGYGSDRGGNSVRVTYIDHETNLHWVWDNEIIVTENITAADCIARMSSWNRKEIDAYKKGAPKDWMLQSRSLLNHVYDFKDNSLDRAYADKNKMIVEDQLLIAGIRLSTVLESIFR